MKNTQRPIGIDLFVGAGGMSLGFEQAGFDVVAAVEMDPIHSAIHTFNFPDCAVLPRSVVGLSGKEIRVAAGIGNKQVDCVFGGAPCQGFSMIGHRALEDPRNRLVLEFVRLVSELVLQGDEIKVAEERHYKLLPAAELDATAVRTYR